MLNKKEIEFYKENGFLVVKNLFDSREVKKGILAIEEILSRSDADKISEKEPKDSSIVRRIWSPTQKQVWGGGILNMAASSVG
ncbi:hypothetical protein [Xenorhabdus sp. KK7.4]|uniref:hypothetical protein n=1 Tax=Xenorhabdus sp. KK7.4 TaxID=1851572 RepID=UPI000C045D6B|nr:hypothetical protein [Xenorhabdus sp. KK7.4]PHM51201.1 hypothetical protein Xekk_03918 [Xenorhabdus sp. KK7.4]